MEYEELHALVCKAAAGDENAFDAICREKMNSILYRANRMIYNPQDAEDVAQEIVLKMYQNIKNLRNPQLFNAWLQSIITNECNTMLRRKWKQNIKLPQTVIDESVDMEMRREFLPQEFVEDEEKREELLEVVASLPTKSRNALVMFYFENMSTTEIAAATGTSVSTVCNHLAKARKSITKKLEAKHGSLASMDGALALPVLTQAMQMEAMALFPQTVVNRTVQSSLVKKEAFKLTAAKTGAARGLFIKITSGVLTAAVVVGGITAIYRMQKAEGTADDPYIISDSAGSTGEGPQPSSRALAETEMFEGEVTGQVLFKNHAGQPISDVGFTPLGFLVELKDDAGNVVAQTTAKEDGWFSFGRLRLPVDSDHVIVVSSPEIELTTRMTENDGKGLLFAIRQAQSEGLLQVYVSLVQAPFGTVVPHGGIGVYGHVNPQSLEYKPDFARIEEAKWEITPKDGTDVLYSGSGTAVQRELALLQRGEYTVKFGAVDVFGNSEELKFDFVIP